MSKTSISANAASRSANFAIHFISTDPMENGEEKTCKRKEGGKLENEENFSGSGMKKRKNRYENMKMSRGPVFFFSLFRSHLSGK